jgi:hypothetical protein
MLREMDRVEEPVPSSMRTVRVPSSTLIQACRPSFSMGTLSDAVLTGG